MKIKFIKPKSIQWYKKRKMGWRLEILIQFSSIQLRSMLINFSGINSDIELDLWIDGSLCSPSIYNLSHLARKMLENRWNVGVTISLRATIKSSRFSIILFVCCSALNNRCRSQSMRCETETKTRCLRQGTENGLLLLRAFQRSFRPQTPNVLLWMKSRSKQQENLAEPNFWPIEGWKQHSRIQFKWFMQCLV